MVGFLSQEWLDRQVAVAGGLPSRPGATARVQYVVSGAPGGEVQYAVEFTDGALTSASLGADPDADLTMALAHADALRIARGELEADEAFMQGRLKITGNMGLYMDLLSVTRSDEYRAAQQELAAATEV